LGVGQRNHPSNGNGLLSTSSDDAGILDYTRVFVYHKLGDQCPVYPNELLDCSRFNEYYWDTYY